MKTTVLKVFLMCLVTVWTMIFLVKYQAILLFDLFNMTKMTDAYFLSIMVVTILIGCSIGILADILNK